MVDEVDMLVKLRDGLQMAIDGIQEYLESKSPREEDDYGKLFWETRQGEKGPYQQTSKAANSNCDLFQALQKNLKQHNGFWRHQGFTYWFHQGDFGVVDRRRCQEAVK